MIELSRVKKIHFVGIGGAGMSGIAEVLHNMGFTVSGSDIGENDTVKRLKTMGIKVYLGHDRDNLDDAETLVFSSAVTRDNPELIEAMRRGIPVIPRAEMLAELMRVKYAVAVAGTHGKTSATSMLAAVLTRAQKDPTYVVGGRLKTAETSESGARLGKSVYLVAEADESDGSFLKLFPTLAVITNIEDDHLDHYGSMDSLRDAFRTFGDNVPFYGAVILNDDCEESRRLLPKFNKRVITYGTGPNARVRAENIDNSIFSLSFDLVIDGVAHGRVRLNMGGAHNVSNALAVIAASMEMGIETDLILEGLKGFYLPERRFQVLHCRKDYLVVDDYAHHPTEIRVTLDTLRRGSYKRVIAVFQPHRYSRLSGLMDRFAHCFNLADQLVLAPVYSAGQTAVPGVDGSALAEKIRKSPRAPGSVVYLDSMEDIITHLNVHTGAGDAVVFLSAGNLTHTAHRFARQLASEETGGAQ